MREVERVAVGVLREAGGLGAGGQARGRRGGLTAAREVLLGAAAERGEGGGDES